MFFFLFLFGVVYSNAQVVSPELKRLLPLVAMRTEAVSKKIETVEKKIPKRRSIMSGIRVWILSTEVVEVYLISPVDRKVTWFNSSDNENLVASISDDLLGEIREEISRACREPLPIITNKEGNRVGGLPSILVERFEGEKYDWALRDVHTVGLEKYTILSKLMSSLDKLLDDSK